MHKSKNSSNWNLENELKNGDGRQMFLRCAEKKVRFDLSFHKSTALDDVTVAVFFFVTFL